MEGQVDVLYNKLRMNVKRKAKVTNKYGFKKLKIKKELRMLPARVHISELPVEMKIKIFEFLPLRDRKSVKLVCKEWHELCNSAPFSHIEKIICCGVYDLNHIEGVLINCKRERLNLKFVCVNFELFPTVFWKQYGARIYSMEVEFSLLNAKTIKNIILNCVNLRHLALFSDCRKRHGKCWCLVDVLHNLNLNGVKNENLISFHVDGWKSKWLSNYTLNGFCTIFPKIKDLFVANSDLEHDEFDELSKDAITFSGVLKKLRSLPNVIEYLNFPWDSHYTEKYWSAIISTPDLTNLKEFNLTFDFTSSDELSQFSRNSIINFLSKQKQLESVVLYMSDFGAEYAQYSVDRFLLRVLDVCPKLRNVYLETDNCFHICGDLFKKLVTSKVESFTVFDNDNLLMFICDLSDLNCYNYTLTYLDLYCYFDENVLLAFVKTFRNLTYLKLCNVSDVVLQAICELQVKLTTLHLEEADRLSDYGFTGQNSNKNAGNLNTYSIRRLQRLEVLKILRLRNHCNITQRTLSEFVFPNLRAFTMNVMDCADRNNAESKKLNDALLKTIENFTMLERVKLFSEEFSIDSWTKISRKLKWLRSIHIVGPKTIKFTKSECQTLFNHFPSLRTVSCSFEHVTLCAYFFDICRKKVIQIKPNTAITEYFDLP